jgi:hypothetical protein
MLIFFSMIFGTIERLTKLCQSMYWSFGGMVGIKSWIT